MNSPVFFILAVVALVIIGAGLISSGLDLMSVFKPPTLDHFVVGNSPFGTSPFGEEGGGSSAGQGEVKKPTTSNEEKAVTPAPVLPSWLSTYQASPYFREVRIASYSVGSPTRQGQVTLRSDSKRTEKIDVTGWQLRAKHGGVFVPKAVEIYQPTGVSEEVNIRLAKSDRVILYTTTSPIGQNLRLNQCIGYLGNTIKFSPTLPRKCPGPESAILKNYSSQCQDYGRTISSCEVPSSNPPLPYFDYQCREYLSQFNYQGCFQKYLGQKDFFSPEWRVWTGIVFLDPRHDRFSLLDKEGRVVDYREY